MWGKRNKVWLRYQQDVLAADMLSAVLLLGYLRYLSVKKMPGHTLEAVDLQRYKVIKKPAKLRQAVRESRTMPFIFTYGLN